MMIMKLNGMDRYSGLFRYGLAKKILVFSGECSGDDHLTVNA